MTLKLLAVLFIFVVLVVPNRISSMTFSTVSVFPVEFLLLGCVLLLPKLVGQVFRWLAAVLLTIGIFLKLVDIGTYQFFDRAFNPVVDSHFWVDGLNFLQGSLGQLGAFFVVVLLCTLMAGILLLVSFILIIIQRCLQKTPKQSGLGLSVGVGLWLILMSMGSQRAASPFYHLMTEHLSQALNTLDDLAVFKQQLSIDPYEKVPNQVLLSKLKGKDVLVVFIESYGRTVLDKASYAEFVRPVLEQATQDLTEKGFYIRSAYVTSPTYGGISWLAHGTLMSGLWVNSQTRYNRLVASDRPSLNRLFKRAGWRTVAVQPAHTMDWPQGAYFGYDQIYAAQDLGYQGKPFNWITMPDQYTLAAFQLRERQSGMRPPVMAEIALISSHAPWTPLPHLVDWNQVGDGSVFIEQASSGDSPETVWKETEHIRVQYRKSIEYALANIVSYIATYGDDNLVVLVLGDHQPAPFVTDESESREVIVHLISHDAKIMTAVKGWQWAEDMLPSNQTPVWGMDKLREQFIGTFSD
jgi:Sulfatase